MVMPYFQAWEQSAALYWAALAATSMTRTSREHEVTSHVHENEDTAMIMTLGIVGARLCSLCSTFAKSFAHHSSKHHVDSDSDSVFSNAFQEMEQAGVVYTRTLVVTG